MRRIIIPTSARAIVAIAGSVFMYLGTNATRADVRVHYGERLDPQTHGPFVIETVVQMLARERANPPDASPEIDRHGVWIVPSRRATSFPHSGDHNVINKWGDTRMGIAFPGPVNVRGAFFSGQAAQGAWTTGVRAIGFRDGQVVAKADWFCRLGNQPAWYAMNLDNVDRIEIVSLPVLRGGGWYGMDDLTFSPTRNAQPGVTEPTVLDFEDLPYRTVLNGSGYAGLTWETGTGIFEIEPAIHHPAVPPGYREDQPAAADESVTLRGGGGTLPQLVMDFAGVIRGDAGSSSFPPDTHGAIGPNHYVETVNRVFAVYDKATGAELLTMHLGTFLPGSNGDPRVLFDHHSGRWVVIVSDFSSRIFLAVSSTDDPTGAWFKSSILVASGSDAGKWPDYPTLGVDADGIYTAAYMVGGFNRMSIFAIDKAPLIADPPSLGTVTAFRELLWEGAIQPAYMYGTPGGQFFVSRRSSTALRIRRLDPPLTSPTLVEVGNVVIPSHSSPPDAPVLGSTTPLDTIGTRLMMSVYRDGSLWTTHTIALDGRAAVRWYELDPVVKSLIQSGTVSDPALYYFMPSIMINRFGRVALGFSGSHAAQYASAYYTGRVPEDPPGEMAPPALLKAGLASQNLIDGFGRNRFGDYSYTSLDPDDELRIWTIQEYIQAGNIWGTWIGVLGSADCNGNFIDDFDDIAAGTSADCNANGVPDECEPADDCNNNLIQDICDIAAGTGTDCNGNFIMDSCDIDAGASADADNDGLPDECQAPVLFVDAAATGAGHGTTWADAYSDLRQALDLARLPSVVASELWVARGTYTPAEPGGSRSDSFLMGNGIAIYGGFDATESNRDDRDPLANPTILSGDLNNDDPGGGVADNAYNVVTATAVDSSAILDGFTITAGQADGLISPSDRGAGMFVKDSAATIANCLFENNFAVASGAGLYNSGGDGSSIIGCTFRNNLAENLGGGMFNNASAPTLIACRFLANHANTRGGGFNNGKTGNPTLVNCLFTGNTSNIGGALGNNGTPKLINCTLSANIAASQGGGVYNLTASSQPEFTNCILWGNQDAGGAGQSAQIFVLAGTPIFAFSDIQGWSTPGVDGNIADDPLFADPDGADNVAGTDDDDLTLLPGSPCIDAGDNAIVPVLVDTDLSGDARFYDDLDTADTGSGAAPIVDMGAEEFLAACPLPCGDFDGSGLVNLQDFATFALCFGRSTAVSQDCLCSDLNRDGAINLNDFATFSLLFDTAPTGVPPNCN